jgi:hypothetical protein
LRKRQYTLEGPAKISSFLCGTPIGFFKQENPIRAGKIDQKESTMNTIFECSYLNTPMGFCEQAIRIRGLRKISSFLCGAPIGFSKLENHIRAGVVGIKN